MRPTVVALIVAVFALCAAGAWAAEPAGPPGAQQVKPEVKQELKALRVQRLEVMKERIDLALLRERGAPAKDLEAAEARVKALQERQREAFQKFRSAHPQAARRLGMALKGRGMGQMAQRGRMQGRGAQQSMGARQGWMGRQGMQQRMCPRCGRMMGPQGRAMGPGMGRGMGPGMGPGMQRGMQPGMGRGMGPWGAPQQPRMRMKQPVPPPEGEEPEE